MACAGIINLNNASKSAVEFSKPQDNILLRGVLLSKPGPVRGSSNIPSIEASQTTASIVLSFLVDLGDLDIDIVKESSGQVVYQTTVDATAGGNLSINTGNWVSGTYYICICNDDNECAEGIFEIY